MLKLLKMSLLSSILRVSSAICRLVPNPYASMSTDSNCMRPLVVSLVSLPLALISPLRKPLRFTPVLLMNAFESSNGNLVRLIVPSSPESLSLSS